MHLWDVFLERADSNEPELFIGSIQGASQVQAVRNAAQFYDHAEHDLLVKPASPTNVENDQALQCAIEQVPHDMLYVEVIGASLYTKIEQFRERPKLVVQGVRWYVEVEVLQKDDETMASILYRVWRKSGMFRATRVAIA